MLKPIEDFLSVIFPVTCAGCGGLLNDHEKVICLDCNYHLPRTQFHKEQDNPVSQVFWGRVFLESAASFLYFNKGNKVQHLLHLLKYKGDREIGIWLGEKYGNDLKQSPFFKDIDMIIPVPLHVSKLRKRGYNQSEMFGVGLSRSMDKPLNTSSLLRITATETQTRKSRYQRWENVSEVFSLVNAENISGKHILLIDDVLTTGATLEASAQVLLEAGKIKLSIATIAYSSH